MGVSGVFCVAARAGQQARLEGVVDMAQAATSLKSLPQGTASDQVRSLHTLTYRHTILSINIVHNNIAVLLFKKYYCQELRVLLFRAVATYLGI